MSNNCYLVVVIISGSTKVTIYAHYTYDMDKIIKTLTCLLYGIHCLNNKSFKVHAS